jgi:molybdenum cofactor cytidylyltransferase
MRFGPVPLDQALGAVLAHSVAGLRKGQVVDAAALARLHGAGLVQVIVARLDPDDLGEDAAAGAIGAALAGAGLRAGPATTGRVNLIAQGAGLLVADARKVAAINRINPLITLATLGQFARVTDGAMVATVKIIAYGVPAADVAQAAAAAQGALHLAPPVLRTACLIETTVDGTIPPPKGREAIRQRLARLGVALSPRLVCPHETPALAQALGAANEDICLILTASATSDPDDVVPAALRLAGGHVERVGMPVDPGNLLVVGARANRPVIGLPGCARSPALNGADWVLERLICGLAVTSDDVAQMGLGGLLKEPPSRPRSRVERS